MTFDRISSYQVDSYFAFVTKLVYLKLQDYVLLPRGIQFEGDNIINLVEPRKLSLYEVLHERKLDLPLVLKLSIILRVARILHTLHSQKLAHGSLTSHNLMFDLDFMKDPEAPFKLYICEVELHDFKKYANMFGNYRCVSVWSPPECLKQPRKKLDPSPEMDVYSFGMLMWEVLHCTLPFDGDLTACSDYVVNSESRPKIDEEGG
jgi:serine/threonine protein kinase